jgi:hypothetical protein
MCTYARACTVLHLSCVVMPVRCFNDLLFPRVLIAVQCTTYDIYTEVAAICFNHVLSFLLRTHHTLLCCATTLNMTALHYVHSQYIHEQPPSIRRCTSMSALDLASQQVWDKSPWNGNFIDAIAVFSNDIRNYSSDNETTRRRSSKPLELLCIHAKLQTL